MTDAPSKPTGRPLTRLEVATLGLVEVFEQDPRLIDICARGDHSVKQALLLLIAISRCMPPAGHA